MSEIEDEDEPAYIVYVNPDHPEEWKVITDNARAIIRRCSHLSFQDIDEAEDMRVFIHADDLRYPSLAVNGTYNFAMDIDAVTFRVGRPHCICRSRYEFECCCDLP